MTDAALQALDVSDAWAAKAAVFHAENPHVYELLVGYARAARNAGVERIGIELLWNRMRWDRRLGTSGDEFKLNQNFKAWYARLIMERERDLEDIFETRARQPFEQAPGQERLFEL